MLDLNKTMQIAQDVVNVRKTSSRSLEPVQENSYRCCCCSEIVNY